MGTVSDNYHLALVKGTYYYHRRVPTHLIEKAKTPVVRFSLRTKVKAEAKRRRAIEDQRTDKWFADLEAGTAVLNEAGSNLAAARKVTLDELMQHAREYVEDEDQRRAKRLLANPPQDQIERGNLLDAIACEQEAARHGDEIAIDRVASEIGKRAGLGDQDPAALLSIASRALGELAMRQGARIDGDHSRSHFDVMFAPGAGDSKPKTTFAVLAEQYLRKVRSEDEANGVGGRTIVKRGVNVAYLLEAIGPDTPLASIDYDRVQELRRTIARTPPNRMKTYPKLSLKEAIERAEKDGRPPMEHLTQGVYTAEFKRMMQYAVDKKLLPSNPAHDLKPLAKDPVPRNKKRSPFTLDQLRGFFTGGFYRSCAPGVVKPYHKPDKAWRFWLPLMMLFTGARPNELCQLYVDDIRQTKAGTWYFNLIDEDEDQSRKNEASKRKVPIHSELIKLGFLAFVERRRKSVGKNGPRLFYELKPATDCPTDFAWYPGKRFNEAFLDAEIERVPRRQVLYSIRHSVRDALRRIKATDEVCYAIGGWTPPGGMAVSADYGDIHNPDLWKETVDTIAYPGLDLSFLYPTK